MTTIHSRSPYVLTVEGHPELTRKVPDAQRSTADACLRELSDRHPERKVQLEEERGREQPMALATREQAHQFAPVAECQPARGLFRAEMPAVGVTTAQLIERFIAEECPGLLGGKLYATILSAMVRDSSNDLKGTGLGANSKPMTSLDWLHKPLSEVTAAHIQAFVNDRLEAVAPPTVHRQLRLLNAVYKVATSRWGVRLDRLPTRDVRRPSINARYRRLSPEEQRRLLDAARCEDRVRSIRLRTRELMDRARTVAAEHNPGSLKRTIKTAYRKARAEALRSYKHVPLFEALLMFQLSTAARRSEALAQLWDRVDFIAQTARLPSLNNYLARTVPVPHEVLVLLKQLPRSSDRVFDIDGKELSNAWRRMRKHADIIDLNMHDLRCEAMNRAAESGLLLTWSDIWAFSGCRQPLSSAQRKFGTRGGIKTRFDAAAEK